MSANDEGPKLNVEDLLFFPGKELNETNIAGRRSPPQPIRLAIGRHGVYKFEREENKVLAFWGYQELTDWSFSGYSFTLNFKNKKDYHLRTDDGQAISHWIESFSKNPEQASIAAQQFKSLGKTNTMRKFSAELRPINYQAKFYTLNPRRTKHTIDQSRMLSAYGVDKNNKTTAATLPPKQQLSSVAVSSEKDQLRWSTGTPSIPLETKAKDCNGYRSASLELESVTGNSGQQRAQSMESLLNEKGPSPLPPSASNGTGKTTPLVIPPLAGSAIIPPRIIRKTSSVDSTEEEAPVVPPRVGSLGHAHTVEHEYSTLEEDSMMIKVDEAELDKRQNSLGMQKTPRPHMYDEVTIRSGGDEPQEVDESGEYDHLVPVRKGHKNPVRRKKDRPQHTLEEEDEMTHSPIRRNESLPPMVFHSPRIQKPPPTSDDDLSPSDTEEDEAPSPLPPHGTGGVVLRRKREETQDPFADLLSAPPSKSHLRWSQNLNPIYDNIKGMKVSPAIAYEASSLLASPDQAILEEDSKGDTVSIDSSSDRRSSSGSGMEAMILVTEPDPVSNPPRRRPHNYEEVAIGGGDERPRTNSKGNRPLSDHYQTIEKATGKAAREFDDKSATLSSPVRRLKSADNMQFAISPRLNKRMINRRSKTVKSCDDFNAPQGRQRAQRVADTMKDFSYINREYRVFYVKMPNGQLISEVVNINRPVVVLIERLMDLLGHNDFSTDSCSIHVEGAMLTTMKEAVLEFGEVQPAKAQVDRSVSLTQLVDSNSLADQGTAPLMLKNALSFRMQGITTSRILRLDDGEDTAAINYPTIPVNNDFHKKWLGIVQGNQPCTLEAAVKLAAIQYQAYFLDRTAENSVVGFCRPNEFLPAEYAGMRGIEQRMYKEQEKIKSRNHVEIQKFYIKYCCSLPTNETLLFPVREPRRRLFQSTRLKPILLGVNKNGIMRVCPKTKEVLDFWEYQVLKNWAYSRRTFVIAFNNKNYPVESNQARWISELVDFFVDSIIHSSPPPQSPQSKN